MERWGIVFFLEIFPEDSGMMKLIFHTLPLNINILNVHAPHAGSSWTAKQTFYDKVMIFVEETPNHEIKIIVGDFNAIIIKNER